MNSDISQNKRTELSPKKMKRNALDWKLMAKMNTMGSIGSEKKVSPYIGAMEPKDLKIFQLAVENKNL